MSSDREIPPLVALVPMKAHSERVPDKNVRPLCGRPLFHWILKALAGSRYVDRIVIDTDSPEIAEQVRAEFEVQIIERPDFLLGDHIVANELIAYDLTQIRDRDFFLQTHATNPLLRTETIDRAVEVYFGQEDHDSLFSVTPLYTRLYWPDGTPVNHDPAELIQTQDLSPVFEENSCLYLFSRQSFHKRDSRLGESPLAFPTDRAESVDIDEELDFQFAQFLMEKRLRAA